MRLPDIFHKQKGYTLSARKIALVRIDGSGNVAKALKILDVIGIPEFDSYQPCTKSNSG